MKISNRAWRKNHGSSVADCRPATDREIPITSLHCVVFQPQNVHNDCRALSRTVARRRWETVELTVAHCRGGVLRTPRQRDSQLTPSRGAAVDCRAQRSTQFLGTFEGTR